jgi:hypothetical protein
LQHISQPEALLPDPSIPIRSQDAADNAGVDSIRIMEKKETSHPTTDTMLVSLYFDKPRIFF